MGALSRSGLGFCHCNDSFLINSETDSRNDLPFWA